MDKKVIAFLVYPELTPLDLVGPLQVLKVLETIGPYRVVTMGERIEPMATDLGLRIQPEVTLEEVERPYALIVPGGVIGPIRAMVNDRVIAYVRAAAETAEIVGSVCTGALILAAAGLLEGRQATTHWSFLGHLGKLGARPVRKRWVEDGKFITAAGVAAGIDMALALAARLAGEPVARTIQTIIEYDPEPPLGGIDWKQVDEPALAGQLMAPFAPEIEKILATKPELAAKLAG